MRQGRARGAWLIDRSPADPGSADRLGRLLARQGLEVTRSPGGFTACGRSYAPGSYVVSLAQPQAQLAEVLMDPTIALEPAFLAEQERRRAKALPAELYDVTAWSLPSMFNLSAARCGKPPASATIPVSADEVGGGMSGATVAVA